MLDFRTIALVGVSLIAVASPGYAQTAAAPAVSDAPDEGFADIVVTAQKREERLQDVPVAVTVVSGDQISRLGGVNIENAQYLVPALNFRKSGVPINQSIFLRGVGTSTFSLAGEPSVSTVLDGVVLSRAGEAFTPLADIARIEVLRGPQGTLFGKNASAGAINIVSVKPGDTLGGYAEGSLFFDNGTEYRAKAAIDIPLSDTLHSRITGFYANYDGNIFNDSPTVNRRVNGYEQYGLRGILVAEPSDTVTLTLIGDWRKSNDDCCAEVIGAPAVLADGTTTALFASRAPLLLPALEGDKGRTIRQNLVNRSEEKGWGVSLQADVELGNMTVTSITAYRRYDNREVRDGDFLNAVYVGVNQSHDDGPQIGKTFSQELRLTSPGGQFIDYVLGAFYSHAETERTFTRANINCSASTLPTIGAGLIPCSTTPGVSTLTFPLATATFGSIFQNTALFGQATINVAERFRLIAGLRFTMDQLDVFHSRQVIVPGNANPNFDAGVFNGGLGGGVSNGVPWRGKTTADNLSGKGGAQFDISDNSMAYATYARGYKGPAFNVFFNLALVGTAPLEAEIADSFEIGLKNTLFDGRVVLNLAGFYAKYKNFQANNPDLDAFGNRVTRFTNAGDISTRGFEAEFQARPADDFTIAGGVAYTDAKVDSFKLPPGGAPTDKVPDGTPLAYAPKWKATLGGDYRIRTGGFADVEIGLQGSYQSSQLSLFVPSALARARGTIKGYGMVDGIIALAGQDDRWKLSFLAKNIFNQSFAAAIADGGPLSGGSASSSLRYLIPREADRYFGLTARLNFGE